MGRERPFVVLFCLPVAFGFVVRDGRQEPKGKKKNNDGQQESTLKEAW